MGSNLTNHQSPTGKERVPSWILGIVSIGLPFLAIVLVAKLFPRAGIILVSGYIGGFMTALFGLFKGIWDLTLPSKRKKPALVGILLCLIGLVIAGILLSIVFVGI